MEEKKVLNEKNLEEVNGGNYGGGGWTWGTVHGVVHYDESSCLTLRDYPNGNPQFYDNGRPVGWQNGDGIPVLPDSRQGDWIRSYKDGFDGWVNANYVWY